MNATYKRGPLHFAAAPCRETLLFRQVPLLLLPALLSGQQHIRHAVADAAFRLLHHVAVDAGGGGYTAVAQPVADAHTVHPVKKQHTGHGVTKSVGVQMGQIVPPLEPHQPIP